MKKDSKTNQSTEEQKKEELKNEIRSYLNDYQSINEDTTITENTKMVLSMLLYTGNGQDKFTIGYRYIEEVTGISKNSISPIVGKLEKKGFINRTKGTRGKNSEYTLNYETMESYVSNCPSVQVSKCTTKKHKKGVQVSKCPSVQPNETTCTPTCTVTCTVKDTDIQLLIKQNEEKIQLNKRTNELLEKLCNLYINNNINNNINKNLKDIISSNNNTEGNNTEEKNNIKEKYTKDNLEKLKENSNDEIFNDEDIQRENESLNENENTSKDKLLDNENLNNENNIQSDEKDNSKVESSKNEISNDENTLNENYDFSILENMYFNEGPSVDSQINEMPSDIPQLPIDEMEREFWGEDTEYRATNSSKENEDLNENSKDEISTDENSKGNEILEYSIFGDEIPQDNENQNTVKFINGKFQVVEQVKDKINLNLSEMKNSKEKSQTIENVKTVKGEISNDLNSSKENENFNVFGKLQSYRDMNSGRVEGYQFNAYDNLTAAKDYSKSFHAAIINLTIESSDLKVSVSDTGTWGMLSRKDGVYSFTASTTDISDGKYIAQQRSLSLEKKGGAAADNENTSNNGTQGDETSKVDSNTTEGKKVAPVQSQNTNEQSESNNDTTANDKEDEKATETVYADEKNAEVDNYTTSTEITAGNSVKMRPEQSDSNTDTTDTPNNDLQASKTSEVDSNTNTTEKVDSMQSQNTNKQSNHNTDVCYDMYGISTDELNDIMGHHHGNGKGAWRNMTIKLHNEETTISKALDHFKDKKKDGKEFMECNTFFYYFDPICFEVDRLHNSKQMTDEQFKDCCDIICKLTRGKTNYWHNTFSHRSPRPNFPSEKRMWELVGQPLVVNADDKKSEVDNYTTSASKVDESSVKMRNTASYDNVVLPTHDDFKNMSLDDIHTKLLSFVNEHKNVSEEDKAYINNLCVAYALEPQYVA